MALNLDLCRRYGKSRCCIGSCSILVIRKCNPWIPWVSLIVRLIAYRMCRQRFYCNKKLLNPSEQTFSFIKAEIEQMFHQKLILTSLHDCGMVLFLHVFSTLVLQPHATCFFLSFFLSFFFASLCFPCYPAEKAEMKHRLRRDLPL